MNVTFTESARQLPPDEFFRIEQATEFLRKIAGDSGRDVTASWDRGGDLPRHQYKLTLADWSGEVSERFFAERLWRDRDMQWAVRNLWGDLLQNRSHKLLDNLLGTSEPAET